MSSMLSASHEEQDAGVVEQICGYLTDVPPRSFFLFAGAGSGKTRTLIEVLRRLTGLLSEYAPGVEYARRLRGRGQTIRVITYTNTAVEVIRGRLGHNRLVVVSTIHSFAWELIQGFDHDIRTELTAEALRKLDEAVTAAKSRKKGPTQRDEATIARLEERLDELRMVGRFTYSPDRQVYGEGALQHQQVLQLLAALLNSRPTLARVLCDKHPVVLIDESQDTTRGVLDALTSVAEAPGRTLSLGLLGDHRQRIYADGHRDLPTAIPASWERPALHMNHRSAKRVVRLINCIWNAELPGRTQRADGGEQHPRSERREGWVRLFVGRAGLSAEQKIACELLCAAHMANVTGDRSWEQHGSGYRILALEHKLAARRAGFYELAVALERADKGRVWERGRARDGSDGGPTPIRVFMDALAALRGAVQFDGSVDGFGAMELLRQHGRLRQLSRLGAEAQKQRMRGLDAAVHGVAACFSAGHDPTLRELLRRVVDANLFDVHEKLFGALDAPPSGAADDGSREGGGSDDPWARVLDRPWSELERYRDYLADRLSYGTHQGVKGEEYRHVQVILDDSEAGGFLFSYDKLLGAQELSKTDLENEATGSETTIDRTVRLLYVTCSRPTDSLAIVYWSANPKAALAAIRNGDWFSEEEVVQIDDLLSESSVGVRSLSRKSAVATP